MGEEGEGSIPRGHSWGVNEGSSSTARGGEAGAGADPSPHFAMRRTEGTQPLPWGRLEGPSMQQGWEGAPLPGGGVHLLVGGIVGGGAKKKCANLPPRARMGIFLDPKGISHPS